MAPRRTALLFVVALPLLLGASPEGQVVGALRRDLASDLRTQRSLLANERKSLLTQLGDAIDLAESTVLTPVQCAGIVSTLEEFQIEVAARTEGYFGLLSSRGQTALNAFLALVPGATALPVGITFGDGGALDQSLRAYVSQVQKLYAPLAKRLAAYQKACEARSGVGVTILLQPPIPEDFPGFDFDTFYGSYSNLSLDLAVGASSLDTSGDGLIALFGSADVSGGTVTVELNGPTSAPDGMSMPMSPSGRWSAIFMGPLAEASYVVRARQGTDGQWVSWHIGVR